jgi:hypothetical protein
MLAQTRGTSQAARANTEMRNAGLRGKARTFAPHGRFAISWHGALPVATIIWLGVKSSREFQAWAAIHCV